MKCLQNLGWAAALAFLLLPHVARGESGSGSLRIAVAPRTTIYVGFSAGELRLAAAADGLAAASPIRALASGGTGADAFDQFPEVPLPIPAEALPNQVTQVSLSLRWIHGSATAVGGLRILHGPKAGQTSAYLQPINLKPGPHPLAAPEIRLADLAQLRLVVTPKARPGELGVAVQLLGGEVPLFNVKRQGVSIPVVVRILDRQGKEVARQSAPLDQYAFG